MSNVIGLTDDFVEIVGYTVKRPNTKQEYLNLCKRFLDKGSYREILCGIMDDDLYNDLTTRYKKEISESLQRIIDAYHSYKS
jgi:hypothetical protein